MTKEKQKSFKDILLSQKKLHKHTNKELAEICGCSIPTIGNFFLGKKGIDIAFLEKLMSFYNLKVFKEF